MCRLRTVASFMNPYQWTLLLGTARLLLAFALLFVVYPRFVFAWVEGGHVRRPSPWEGVLVMAGVTVTSIYTLVLLGLYDPIGLLILYLLIAAVTFVLRSRGGAAAWAAGTYTGLLRRLDTPPEARAPLFDVRAALRRAAGGVRGPGLAVLALLLYVAATRLAPIVGETAPFSVHYYAVLEGVKYLQIGDLTPTGMYASRGVQSFILSLFALSQVEPGLIVHLFGAAAAVLVTYGLYRTVRELTGSAAAGFAAGAGFALGAPLLPFNIQHQVEANAALLAAAFALPAVVYAARYVARGHGRHGRAGAGAFVAAVLTQATVGLVAVAAIAVFAVAGLVRGRQRGTHRRGMRALGLAAAGLLLVGLPPLLAVFFAAPAEGVRMVRDVAQGTPFSLRLPVAWVDAGVPLVGTLLVLAALRLRRPLRAAAAGGGGLLLGLYAAYRAAWTDAAVLLNPEVMGLLLSIALCAGAGLLLHAAFVAAEEHLGTLRRARRRYRPAAAAVLTLFVLATAGAAVPRFSLTVEPSGFVSGLQAVRQVATPYTWTVVSHHGTGIRAMNGGWYMDYGYFLNNYDANRYDPDGPQAIPTDVYLFVETNPLVAGVVDELMPVGDRLMVRVHDWAQAYGRRRPLPVFYQDDDVIVYRIAAPPDDRARRGPRPTAE